LQTHGVDVEEAGLMTAPIRSFLFVPGDSERKIEKSRGSNADALVLDLEDAVAPSRKSIARDMVAAYLKTGNFRPGTKQWVRINPLTTPEALSDLAAIVAGRPAGILLPKAEGPRDIIQLGYYLDALEAREGIPVGATAILPVATETAGASFSLGSYKHHALPRLFGFTWGAEDLSASIGAATNRSEDGRLSLTYRMARSLMLLAAKACGAQALDAVHVDYRDIAGLKADSVASRREGFTGRFAIHPDQVDPINESYSPSQEDIAIAERIVAAFAAAPEAGTIGVDGKMFDKPHLVQAQKVLAMRDAFGLGR
jgi:citrate lyase subunit beta/citryl-CoA lyase